MAPAFVPSASCLFAPRAARAALSARGGRRALRAAPRMGLRDYIYGLVDQGRAAAGASMALAEPIKAPEKHAVLGTPMEKPPGGWPEGLEEATFGLGCFWGAERKFWQAHGVYTTSVGYAGGSVENPSYRAVCSGRTGHAEVVNVVFDTSKTSFEKMLDVFWDSHDPTTLNQQGNDVGSQYRSAIFYYNEAQKAAIEASRDHFNALLKKGGRNPIVTEVAPAAAYYFAEEYHQQYLEKNPGGYCGLQGTNLYEPRSE